MHYTLFELCLRPAAHICPVCVGIPNSRLCRKTSLFPAKNGLTPVHFSHLYEQRYASEMHVIPNGYALPKLWLRHSLLIWSNRLRITTCVAGYRESIYSCAQDKGATIISWRDSFLTGEFHCEDHDINIHEFGVHAQSAYGTTRHPFEFPALLRIQPTDYRIQKRRSSVSRINCAMKSEVSSGVK